MAAEDEKKPLSVAMLGSGLFATSSHAPVLVKRPETFRCIAVWSRSEASASNLAAVLNDAKPPQQQAQIYFGPDGLNELLARSDVQAVILALPLDVQPEYIQQCLKAGKHVLSEKPVAATVQAAKALLASSYDDKLVWSVAENFRYEPAIVAAAEAVHTKIGTPFLFSLNMRIPFLPDNKYLNTAWRKKPSWYGGLFIDAFVHPASMLRLIFGNTNADTVSARTTSRVDYLPSVDTMTAHVSWRKAAEEEAVQGSISITYACTTSLKVELDVMGTGGTVTLARRLDGPGYRLTVQSNNLGGKADPPTVEEIGFGGIEAEFLAFAQACTSSSSRSDLKNTPQEALRDLALVEALLESGQNNGAVTKVPEV